MKLKQINNNNYKLQQSKKIIQYKNADKMETNLKRCIQPKIREISNINTCVAMEMCLIQSFKIGISQFEKIYIKNVDSSSKTPIYLTFDNYSSYKLYRLTVNYVHVPKLNKLNVNIENCTSARKHVNIKFLII